MRVLIMPNPRQHLLLSVFFSVGHFCEFIVLSIYLVLICISLVVNVVEHFFLCVLAFHLSSFVTYLFTFFCYCLVAFITELSRVLAIFWIQILCQTNVLQIFSPNLWFAYLLPHLYLLITELKIFY